MSKKLIITFIVLIIVLVGIVGYFVVVKKPKTIISPPLDSFPSIDIEAGGEINELNSKLILSTREVIEENRIGSELRLVLTTDREYPNGCYSLAGGSKIVNNKIFVMFSGISIYKGLCSQAFQAPSFIVILPNTPKNYSLFVKYKDSLDRYGIVVKEDKINFASESKGKFTILPNKEFLRIPTNSMWVNIGYSNRDKFTSQKKKLIDGLISLGAKKFIPKKGNYAYGGFWGITTLERGLSPDGREYMSGSHFNDFLYFTFTGNISAVRDLVSEFTEYRCESSKGDCMSIDIRTWRGEAVSSWMLK